MIDCALVFAADIAAGEVLVIAKLRLKKFLTGLNMKATVGRAGWTFM